MTQHSTPEELPEYSLLLRLKNLSNIGSSWSDIVPLGLSEPLIKISTLKYVKRLSEK